MNRIATNRKTTVRKTWAGLAAIAVAAAFGCSQGTPGGPGAKGKSPVYGQAGDTFNLSVPIMASTVQQGGTIDAVVGIARGVNFDEDVSLLFTDLPKGVTVEPASPQIKRGELDAKIKIHAASETPTGDFKVDVTGHPTKGSDAKVDFKLAVVAKDGFTVSMPRGMTPVVQGGTRQIEIDIDRQKLFDEDVTLQFGEFPTGVTVKPAEPVIKRDETKARLELTATKDAALGNFTVKVTGHPVKGDDAVAELRLNIVKP
jgi:hypothetical protein